MCSAALELCLINDDVDDDNCSAWHAHCRNTKKHKPGWTWQLSSTDRSYFKMFYFVLKISKITELATNVSDRGRNHAVKVGGRLGHWWCESRERGGYCGSGSSRIFERRVGELRIMWKVGGSVQIWGGSWPLWPPSGCALVSDDCMWVSG